MSDLTGYHPAAAAFSAKHVDLGLPARPAGRIVAGLAPETLENKAVDKSVKFALSAVPGVGKGLAQGFDLRQSSLKLAATFNDRHSSLGAKVGAAIHAAEDLFGLTKEVARPLRDNATFQAIGHGLTFCALISDLWDAATEAPEPLFGIRSAP